MKCFILNLKDFYAYKKLLFVLLYNKKIADWFSFSDVNATSLEEMTSGRLRLINEVLSQGRVIITDRLHASIMSLLMGKPHVIINEKYKKIWHTRESAFHGRAECAAEYLGARYANSIEEAIEIAKAILELYSV